MTQFFITACLLTGVLLAPGCACKKYVRTAVDPVRARVDQAEEQTTNNGKAIEDARSPLNPAGERAETGASAVQERAALAEQHAATAHYHANQAMRRANQAAENGHSEISANRPEATDAITWKQRLWNQRLMRSW